MGASDYYLTSSGHVAAVTVGTRSHVRIALATAGPDPGE
jgi:hypothetical protein